MAKRPTDLYYYCNCPIHGSQARHYTSNGKCVQCRQEAYESKPGVLSRRAEHAKKVEADAIWSKNRAHNFFITQVKPILERGGHVEFQPYGVKVPRKPRRGRPKR